MTAGDTMYPIVVLQDRYSGVYSGGGWLAIARGTEPVAGSVTRVQFCLEGNDGPSGDDLEAAAFWQTPPEWISAGLTPDAAIHALHKGGR